MIVRWQVGASHRPVRGRARRVQRPSALGRSRSSPKRRSASSGPCVARQHDENFALSSVSLNGSSGPPTGFSRLIEKVLPPLVRIVMMAGEVADSSEIAESNDIEK